MVACGLLDKTVAVFHRRTLDRVATLRAHDHHIWSIDQVKKLPPSPHSSKCKKNVGK